MKYCPDCKSEIIIGAKFCFECGYEFIKLQHVEQVDFSSINSKQEDFLSLIFNSKKEEIMNPFRINKNNEFITYYPLGMEPFKIRSINADYFKNILFTADSKFIAAGTESGIHFWDVKNQEHVFTIDTGENENSIKLPAQLLKFTSDGKYLLYIISRRIHVWNLIENKLEQVSSFDILTNCTFSPDLTYVASIEYECVKIWNIIENELVNIIATQNSIVGIDFSPDSKYLLLIECDKKEILLWDFINLVPVNKIMLSDEVINQVMENQSSIKLSPDGKILGYFINWSYEEPGFIFTHKRNFKNVFFKSLTDINNKLNSVDLNYNTDCAVIKYSSNSQLSVIATNKEIIICNLLDNHSNRNIRLEEKAEYRVSAMLSDFSPNGKLLATADNYKISIWKLI